MIHTSNMIVSAKPTSFAQQRKGFFRRFQHESGPMPTIREKTNSSDGTVTTLSEDDNESLSSQFSLSSSSSYTIYDPSDPLGATYENLPDNALHACLSLLSNKNIDLSRLGLQRLNLLISGRTVVSDSYRSQEIAPFVLVFGGPLGSMEELLRFIFATLICDAPHIHCYCDESLCPSTMQTTCSKEEEALESWILDEYDPVKGTTNTDPSDDELTAASYHSRVSSALNINVLRKSQGKGRGALHNHALKILANALEKIYYAVDDPRALDGGMNLHCPLWKSIILSLVGNLERNNNITTTVHSLKILRFLSYFQPEMILPLIQYTLMPLLVDLIDCGEKKSVPIISTEASKLLEYTQGK